MGGGWGRSGFARPNLTQAFIFQVKGSLISNEGEILNKKLLQVTSYVDFKYKAKT